MKCADATVLWEIPLPKIARSDRICSFGSRYFNGRELDKEMVLAERYLVRVPRAFGRCDTEAR